jgi:glycosyltransferase involved in cell wall biosynthesis
VTRDRPLISIAIATFDRAPVLARALESLCHLQPSDQFDTELVVIDNGSRDNTRDIVQGFADRLPDIRWVYEPNAGLPFARNRAVAEAHGDWIAFFDDDQLAAPDWLIQLFETAQTEDVKCVGGSRSLLIEAQLQDSLPAYSRSLLGEIDVAHKHDYHGSHLPCTGNVLLAKSLFEQIGAFDPSVLDGGEDTDFFNRLLRSGTRCVYNPDAKVQHIIAPRRLEKDYLESIAFRHGRHICRRNLTHGSFLSATVSGVVRFLTSGVSAVVLAKKHQLLRQTYRAISASCKWKRVCGYWSYLRAYKGPRSQDVQSTMHRGKG